MGDTRKPTRLNKQKWHSKIIMPIRVSSMLQYKNAYIFRSIKQFQPTLKQFYLPQKQKICCGVCKIFIDFFLILSNTDITQKSTPVFNEIKDEVERNDKPVKYMSRACGLLRTAS
jgi:hypothetical protein